MSDELFADGDWHKVVGQIAALRTRIMKLQHQIDISNASANDLLWIVNIAKSPLLTLAQNCDLHPVISCYSHSFTISQQL